MRVRRGRGVLGLVALLAGIAGSGVALAAGEPSPVPDVRAAAGAIDGGPVIRASLDAFDGVTSYRYEHRGVEDQASGIEAVTTGTVIDGDPFRAVRSVSTGGETGWVEIQVGGEAWRSLYGGGFAAMPDGVDPHPGPLGAWAASLLDAADAGIVLGVPESAVVDGVEVLRYAGTTAPTDLAASPDPMGDRPLAAQVELVVEAASGRLVEATVATQRSDALPLWDAPIVRSSLEHIRIEGVDDPANAVEAPLVGPNPTAAPSGDPALEAVVLGALDALAAAPSWHADTEQVSLGGRSGEGRVVVTSPEPAVEVWTLTAGHRGVSVRAFGDGMWQAFGDSAAWKAVDPVPDACFGGPCDVAGLTDIGRGLRSVAATFTELPAETFDGAAVRHLRSDAGMVGFDGPIPGATDLWIDAATGLPVRFRFDGLGFVRETRISRVGDPSLAVERPGA